MTQIGKKRRMLIAGNWKMNGSAAANVALLQGFHDCWMHSKLGQLGCDVLVCPPHLYLDQIRGVVAVNTTSGAIKIGAQDVSSHDKGAFTGEVSAAMLRDLGVSHAIVGHSERRQHHGESNAIVGAKAKAAQSAGLIPIVCVGESLAQRDSGAFEQVVRGQLQEVLSVPGVDPAQMVLAYEPIWAIGTGRNATPEQAQAVHASLRECWRGLGCEHGTILYGGSMNAANASQLLSQPDVDGGLVGGASLKSEDFFEIVAAAHALSRPI